MRAPGAGLRIAGAITVGLGSAFLITGVVFNLKHNSMIHDPQGDYSGDGADSARRYKTLGNVGYAAGAACVAGATTVLPARSPSQQSTALPIRQVALAP